MPVSLALSTRPVAIERLVCMCARVSVRECRYRVAHQVASISHKNHWQLNDTNYEFTNRRKSVDK